MPAAITGAAETLTNEPRGTCTGDPEAMSATATQKARAKYPEIDPSKLSTGQISQLPISRTAAAKGTATNRIERFLFNGRATPGCQQEDRKYRERNYELPIQPSYQEGYSPTRSA